MVKRGVVSLSGNVSTDPASIASTQITMMLLLLLLMMMMTMFIPFSKHPCMFTKDIKIRSLRPRCARASLHSLRDALAALVHRVARSYRNGLRQSPGTNPNPLPHLTPTTVTAAAPLTNTAVLNNHAPHPRPPLCSLFAAP